jgi:hypothetical protein
MNKEVKAKWVAALRSGKYEQGDGALLMDGKFCCLGVLCDLHAKETGLKWSVEEGAGCYLDDSELPPKEVAKWAGLTAEDPEVLIDGVAQPISSHNDGRRDIALDAKPFSVIADAIEEQL